MTVKEYQRYLEGLTPDALMDKTWHRAGFTVKVIGGGDGDIVTTQGTFDAYDLAKLVIMNSLIEGEAK